LYGHQEVVSIEEISDNLKNDLRYLGITLGIVVLMIGFGNIVTSSEPVEVGTVEVETECFGAEIGTCLGIQHETHTTYNFDNYTSPEPGTEDYYRKIEAELMIQAYDICREETGMNWTDKAEYENKTGEEWLQEDNVDLLPCEETFHREIEEDQANIMN